MGGTFYITDENISLPGARWRCRALSSWLPGVEEWRSTPTPGSQMAVQSTCQLAPGSGRVALNSHSRESNGGAEHLPVGPREWKSSARLSLPGVKWRCRALSSWPPGVEEWRSTPTPGSQRAVQSTFQLAPGSGRVALDFHSRDSNGGAEHFPVGSREWKSGARLSLPGVKWRCRVLSSWLPGVEEWRWTFTPGSGSVALEFTPGSQMAVQEASQWTSGSPGVN